ncbi:MAG: hypothetical protein AB7V32_06475 [Candidatus Berkiella sp.]
MRNEIIGLIVGIGLVYAQAVVAKETHPAKAHKVAANTQHSQKVAKKNYYKHDKKAQRSKSSQVQADDYYDQDGRAYIGPNPTATSLKQNRKYIENYESDLDQMRSHR